MFRSLALRRSRAPDGSQLINGKYFDQFGGLSDYTGLGLAVTGSVPDQHQYHPDPSCLQACRRWYSHYSSAHGAYYLDWQNHRLRPLAKKNPFGARAVVRPSLSLEFILTPARSFAAPVQAKPMPKPDTNSNDGPRLNEAITAPVIRLVTDDGHSVVSRREALDHAKNLNLDLVEVQRKANPPVCKIMDYHKEKFKQEVKEKERAKSKSAISLRSGDNKEVRFKGKIEMKDLKTKADAVIRLMERGYRVKCMALPRGNEGGNTGELLLRLIPLIEDVSVVESGPHIDEKQAYLIVRHIKFAAKKSGKKMNKVMDAVAEGIQAVASGTAVTDVKAPQSEEEWQPVHSSSVSEDEAQEQQSHRTIFTPPKPGVDSLRSGLQVSKEPPPVVESNRYSKRTETRGGYHHSNSTGTSNAAPYFEASRNPGWTQPNSGPPGAARNRGWAPPNPGPPGAARNPGWTPPNPGPPGAARNPGWTPPNSGPPGTARNPGWTPPNPGPPGAARNPGWTPPNSDPPGAARNPGWTPPNPGPPGASRNPGWTPPPNSGPPGAARNPDSGGQGRYGGPMQSRTNGTDSPSKSYGVFSAPKGASGERRPTSPTPIFGNIGNQKPASSGSQNSGDSPAVESSSPLPPARKYGIFSSTKNASSGN